MYLHFLMYFVMVNSNSTYFFIVRHYLMRNCELLDVYVTVTHKIVPNNKKLCQIQVCHYKIHTLENVTPLFFHLILVRSRMYTIIYLHIALPQLEDIRGNAELSVQGEGSHASPMQIFNNTPYKITIYLTFLPYLTLHLTLP